MKLDIAGPPTTSILPGCDIFGGLDRIYCLVNKSMLALLVGVHLETVTGSGTQCRKTDNHLALVDQAVRVRLPEIFRSYSIVMYCLILFGVLL